ncbi:MAG: cytochrome c biogenesis CcdA family protein [Acidimicrobiales bacterium]
MIGQLVALFGAGVASFLAPCVVPLVPAYLGIVAGGSGEGGPARSVPATVVFVAGFASVFAGLGAVAGEVGSSLHQVQGVVQRVGGVVVIVMGLALLGVLRRGPLGRERRLLTRLPAGGGRLRPFVVGVAFGAAWSPCVGPLLGAALAVAASTGQALRGTVLLAAYALGIGVPFLLASLGLASSPGATARLRRVGPAVERVGGALLVALGVLLVSGAYVHLTSYLARFTPATGGL